MRIFVTPELRASAGLQHVFVSKLLLQSLIPDQAREEVPRMGSLFLVGGRGRGGRGFGECPWRLGQAHQSSHHPAVALCVHL